MAAVPAVRRPPVAMNSLAARAASTKALPYQHFPSLRTPAQVSARHVEHQWRSSPLPPPSATTLLRHSYRTARAHALHSLPSLPGRPSGLGLGAPRRGQRPLPSTGTRRAARPPPPRARDGDAASDVPKFKGYPPMQTRPQWYWRLLALIPYVMPMAEAWIHAEPAHALHYWLEVYEKVAMPVLEQMGKLPQWFPMFYFFAAYLGVVRNNRFPHFLRFHFITGMLLEITLQVLGQLNEWLPQSVIWGKLGTHFWLFATFAFILVTVEAVLCAVRGMYADIPFISDAAYMQIPYE